MTTTISPRAAAGVSAWTLPSGVADADRSLLAAGGLLLGILPVCLLLGVHDPRLVGGVGTWVKPAKFAASLGVHLVTLALLWGYTAGFGQTRTGVVLARAISAAALFEFAYIAVRAARGEASHYNVGTPLGALMFQLMGVGATLLVLGPAAAGIAAWRRRPADAFSRTAALAMGVSGVLAFVTGAALSVKGGHHVGLHAPGDPVWPLVGWSLTAGDLRPAHFVALHALQAIPLVALLAGAAAPAVRARLVAATAAALAAASLAAMAWALAGRPLAI